MKKSERKSSTRRLPKPGKSKIEGEKPPRGQQPVMLTCDMCGEPMQKGYMQSDFCRDCYDMGHGGRNVSEFGE